jgi:histidinol-phosphate/aromatic aminotransferase/cobyric acid decarboxylase-like protein
MSIRPNLSVELNRYPDGGAYRLRQALADRHGVRFEEITVCAGADAVIGYASLATLDPGDEVVTGWPSFPSYVLDPLKLGATPVRVPLRRHRLDLDAMLAAITSRTKLVFIAAPNNPTGTTTSRAELAACLDAVPPHVLTVVDQACLEYIEDPDYRTRSRSTQRPAAACSCSAPSRRSTASRDCALGTGSAPRRSSRQSARCAEHST